MDFNLRKTKFMTCSFTFEDIEDCLRGKLNREPKLKEVLSVINNIDEDLMLKKMFEAGWDVVHKALDKFQEEA